MQTGRMITTIEELIASGKRGRDKARSHKNQPLPSELFDWDAAIARFKTMMAQRYGGGPVPAPAPPGGCGGDLWSPR